jgi:hypothetical protein
MNENADVASVRLGINNNREGHRKQRKRELHDRG